MVNGLKQLRDKYERMLANVPAMMENAANEAAGEILARTIKRTPVGDYTVEVKTEKVAKRTSKNHKKGDKWTETKKVPDGSGKKGGRLKRSWTAGKPQKHGSLYSVMIKNVTEYASYVEYGHRTRGGKKWVPGQFMLTKSIMEVEKIVPYIVLKNMDELLKENL